MTCLKKVIVPLSERSFIMLIIQTKLDSNKNKTKNKKHKKQKREWKWDKIISCPLKIKRHKMFQKDFSFFHSSHRSIKKKKRKN